MAGPKDRMREVMRVGGGAAHTEWGRSLQPVWAWWMLTHDPHDVEISIVRGVVEMVRDPNPMPL